jgi:predicted aconitase with swiveling domain
MPELSSRVLIAGEARAPLLKLESNISFWGGIDPTTGVVIDSRHPQSGECVDGKVLAMNRSIGSSSGSAILLELMRLHRGPAGIILVEPDFIVTLGAVVAREMDFAHIPVVQVSNEEFCRLAGPVTISHDGKVRY